MRKFMRTRTRSRDRDLDAEHEAAPAPAPAPQPAHKTNGHANVIADAASRRGDHSTFSSMQWSGCESGEEQEPPWEDSEFPASWRAIGDRRAAANLHWLRPHELCARPTFLGGGGAAIDPHSELFAQRWRLQLGPLADPHLCCAAAALALTPRLLARVAPAQHPHPGRRYRFRFWVWDSWREVCVDDRLPCAAGVPAGARAGMPHDFTLPLLEKAYAKLQGSWRALRTGGSLAQALRSLTGGAVQALLPRRMPRALLSRVLVSGVPRATLLVASAARGSSGGVLAQRPYLVTGLARVQPRREPLVRLRAVCCPAPAAAAVALDADDEVLAAHAPARGDFWMSLKELCASFSELEVVYLGPEEWVLEPALQRRRAWRCAVARRPWRAGLSAGGPPGGTHAHANPCFHVRVSRATSLVVALAQPARHHGIGLSVLAAADKDKAHPLHVTHASRVHETCAFLSLPAGHYVVMPHTRRPHTDCAFLLRILTDDQADVWEENEDNSVIRSALAELEDVQAAMSDDMRSSLCRRMRVVPGEWVDARAARAALALGSESRCSRALARPLLALADTELRGTAPPDMLPALLQLVAQWAAAYDAVAGWGRGAVSSYKVRALLAAAGVRASNKVLEGVVSRWGRRRRLARDDYLVAVATLHIAHERHRCLAGRMKSLPLSLEEMILMTIYS